MRSLEEIVEELTDSELMEHLPERDLIDIALQIQRNEILESGIAGDTAISLTSVIEDLNSELVDLNRTLDKIANTLYNKEG